MPAAPPGQEASLNALAEELGRLPPDERAARFRLLPKNTAAQVFDVLDPPQQRELLEGLRNLDVRALIEGMEPDDRVRLLEEMPAGVAQKLLAELSPDQRELTSVLLGYPSESAGRIMSPIYLDLRPQSTVADALRKVREQGRGIEALHILPVRDSERCLLGAARLVDLVRADPDARVAELMDPDYPSVSAYEDQEPVARLMQEADLLAISVVDSEQRLVGLVTVDDAMEVLELEETEDLSRAGAAEPLGAPYHAVAVRQLVRSRVVWLLLLVAAASLTVSVLGAFESTLESIVTLALFIPLLIGTGGNCGAQAATTITRALAVGDVRFKDLASTLFKETRVGFSVGLLFAVVGFPLVSIIWYVDLAATVSLTLLLICTWATLVGAFLPLASSRLGIDPAVVSAPVVTTLVDATGLLIYFAIAQIILL
ncbi:MAG: magnesium transporter [Solirubrobacterales bacterium]|jgi:magnesium transporter|nr:magnesium transporter [Solirubrobacterales bacterium]